MTTEPDGAAGLLAGFAQWLADSLLTEAARFNMKPEPDTDIAQERRIRMLGVMARTAVAIHKLEEREALRRDSGAPDEVDMNDRPDDAETIERKYVLLHQRLAEYAAKLDARRDQIARAAGVPEPDPGDLAFSGEPRAA